MSLRSASAPRRYTCCTLDRGWSSSACTMTRMTRLIAPGTSISWAHSSGTSLKPRLRAPSAGNSLRRSGVAVKITLIRSSVPIWLRSMISVSSSATAASRCSRSSRSSLIAPRIARTATRLTLPWPPTLGSLPAFRRHKCDKLGDHLLTAPVMIEKDARRSEAGGREQLAELDPVQRPGTAGPQVAEGDWPDLGPDQALHRMSGRFQHPAHDPVPALVQHQLDHQPVGGSADHPERVHPGEPVVQLNPRP